MNNGQRKPEAGHDPRQALVRRQLVSIIRARFRKGLESSAANPAAAARALRALSGWAEAFGFPGVASSARSAEVALGDQEQGPTGSADHYQRALLALEQQIEKLEQEFEALEANGPEDWGPP